MMLTSGQRVLIAGVLADDGLDFARACVLADKVADALAALERGLVGEDRAWREDAAEFSRGRERAEFEHGFNEMDRA